MAFTQRFPDADSIKLANLDLFIGPTEGSTTQIRNDDHVLHVLKVSSGMPRVEKVHLYRGDFLIPGKASVSLRIRDAQS